MKLAMSEERVAEVEMQLEQSRRDREESMNVSVEVQVLREKNARLSSEEQALFQMQQRNSELTQRLGEMQRELRELGDLGLRGIKDVSHQGRGLNSAGKINVENTSGSNGDVALISLAGLPSSNSGLSKSEQDLRAHLKQIADLSSQRDRLVKENQRLKLAAKQADQRMKAALQDHLALRQKLNQTEDDLAASKMQISNLMGEIDHERSLRGDRDALVKKSQELHVEVVELRGLVEESRLASVQLAKAKEDLASAEDQISLLEERLADITQEAELNSIGHNQVDNLRSMLELRSRENRDLVLQVQSLERRVQELQALETRYSDAADELVELKFKVRRENLNGYNVC
jgi:DNA repair exonuclease SbcCD ATPase subunit